MPGLACTKASACADRVPVPRGRPRRRPPVVRGELRRVDLRLGPGGSYFQRRPLARIAGSEHATRIATAICRKHNRESRTGPYVQRRRKVAKLMPLLAAGIVAIPRGRLCFIAATTDDAGSLHAEAFTVEPDRSASSTTVEPASCPVGLLRGRYRRVLRTGPKEDDQRRGGPAGTQRAAGPVRGCCAAWQWAAVR